MADQPMPDPCPFCRKPVADNFFFAITSPPAAITTYVFCLSCGAQGPLVNGADVNSAIAAWNLRSVGTA